MPFEIVGGRYIAMVDQSYNSDGSVGEAKVFIYDLAKNNFTTLLNTSQNGAYLEPNIFANPVNKKLVLLYRPDYKRDRITYNVTPGREVVVREIEVPGYSYRDTEFTLPPGFENVWASYIDGRIAFSNGENFVYLGQDTLSEIQNFNYSVNNYVKKKISYRIDGSRVDATGLSLNYLDLLAPAGAIVASFPISIYDYVSPFDESADSVYLESFPAEADASNYLRYDKNNHSVEDLLTGRIDGLFLLGALY